MGDLLLVNEGFILENLYRGQIKISKMQGGRLFKEGNVGGDM